MDATLEQLEGDVWPESDVHTPLIDSCHRLRKVPIEALTAGDIRLLLGQRIGVRHLVPRSIELLDVDPMVDSSLFPGDLLIATLRADACRFRGFPELRRRLVAIAARAQAMIEQLADSPSLQGELSALLSDYER